LLDLGAEVTLVDSFVPDSGANRFNLSGVESDLSVIIADVCDREQMHDLVVGRDYLFHLAGQTSHVGSMADPFGDLAANATASLTLLELCRTVNPAIRILYAGTRQVYGRSHYLPVDERHPLEPVDYNGVSKLAGELYHLVCHHVYGLRTTSLRLPNVYGPRMRVKDARQTFIGWWVRQVLAGQEIQVYGDGTQVRGFNYVDDVVQAFLLTAANRLAEGQIYNLGGVEPMPLLELARLLIEINGSGSYKLVPFPEERQKIDIGSYIGDYNRIQAQLGWQPSVPLRQGLAQTLAFYRQFHQYYW